MLRLKILIIAVLCFTLAIAGDVYCALVPVDIQFSADTDGNQPALNAWTPVAGAPITKPAGLTIGGSSASILVKDSYVDSNPADAVIMPGKSVLISKSTANSETADFYAFRFNAADKVTSGTVYISFDYMADSTCQGNMFLALKSQDNVGYLEQMAFGSASYLPNSPGSIQSALNAGAPVLGNYVKGRINHIILKLDMTNHQLTVYLNGSQIGGTNALSYYPHGIDFGVVRIYSGTNFSGKFVFDNFYFGSLPQTCEDVRTVRLGTPYTPIVPADIKFTYDGPNLPPPTQFTPNAGEPVIKMQQITAPVGGSILVKQNFADSVKGTVMTGNSVVLDSLLANTNFRAIGYNSADKVTSGTVYISFDFMADSQNSGNLFLSLMNAEHTGYLEMMAFGMNGLIQSALNGSAPVLGSYVMGEINHIILKLDMTNHQLTVYLNGSQIGGTNALSYYPNGTNFGIVKISAGTTATIKFAFDNFYVNNVPQTCEEAKLVGMVYDGDLTQDCKVDIADLKELTESWIDETSLMQSVYSNAREDISAADNNPVIFAPSINSIMIDGSISDWSGGSDWATFGKWYDPNVNGQVGAVVVGLDSTTQAKFAWNDSSDLLYVAIQSTEGENMILEVGGLAIIPAGYTGDVKPSDCNMATQIELSEIAGGIPDITNQFGGITTGIVAASNYNPSTGIETVEMAIPIYSNWMNNGTKIALSSASEAYIYVNVFNSSQTYGDALCANGKYIREFNTDVRLRTLVKLRQNARPNNCADLPSYVKDIYDLNDDCVINFGDFSQLASEWMNKCVFCAPLN